MQTLEPRLLYLNVPYRNQDDLPVFDTAIPDLNLVQLFRTNRYVGADRVGDANQLSVGVTTRLLDARDGRQFLSATLGQAYYFEDPRVRLPDETPRDRVLVRRRGRGRTSAAYKNWNARFGYQWNPDETRRPNGRRSSCSTRRRPAGSSMQGIGFVATCSSSSTSPAAWPIIERVAWLCALGVFDARRKDARPVRRFRILVLLLGGAVRDPTIRFQPHRRFRYVVRHPA